MVAWESGMPIGPKLCVATEVFFCDVLRILLSDFDEGLKQPILDIEERSCEWHVCYYHDCGAQPANSFRRMIDFLIFHA